MSKSPKLPTGFQVAIPTGNNEWLGLGSVVYNQRSLLNIRFLWLPKDSDTLAPSKKGVCVPLGLGKALIELITEVLESDTAVPTVIR